MLKTMVNISSMRQRAVTKGPWHDQKRSRSDHARGPRPAGNRSNPPTASAARIAEGHVQKLSRVDGLGTSTAHQADKHGTPLQRAKEANCRRCDSTPACASGLRIHSWRQLRW